MNIDSSSLVIIWLLTLCGGVPKEQNYNLTTLNDRLTAQEASTSSLDPLQPDVTTNVHRKHSPHTFMPPIQIEASANFSTSPQLSNSTLAENSTEGQQADFSVQPSTPATAAMYMEMSSTPSKGATIAPHFTDAVSVPTTHRTGTTHFISTPTTSTQSAKKVAVQPTGPSESTSTTTKKTLEDITTPEKKLFFEKKEAKKEANHGTVVAWIIGGALVLMMISFLIIYVKKHKLNEQQMTTKNWAGPSPFIENGEDNSQVRLQSSNQISLFSFLPQRLSRRLSLLPETDEEMEDINPGTTFGDRRPEGSSAQQVTAGDVQSSTGATASTPETKTTDDIAETKENSVHAASSQTNEPTTPDDLEAVSLTDDFPANKVGEAAKMTTCNHHATVVNGSATSVTQNTGN